MLIHNAEVTGSLNINNVPFNSGSFSGSFQGDGSQLSGVTGATTASYVEYSNVGNKPTLVSGSEQISFNGIVDKPTLVSGSAQITYSGLSGIPEGIVSGSSQVSFNGIVDKPTLVSGSSQVTYSGLSGIPAGIVSGSSQVTYSGLTGIPAGIVSSSAQVEGYGIFATTGSNVFQSNQVITGSLFISQNLVVAGSSSIQYISSSVVDIADNIITVNAFNPGVRFGGLAVIDSGSSPQVSGSLLFDSIKDQWIFIHETPGTVTSSVLLMGPETYNDLGNETYLSVNRLSKGTGIEHLRDSNITDTGTIVSINSNTQVTGSFTVITGSAVELQVTNLGVNIGSALTDSHIISGSLRVNPNGLFVSGSGVVGIGTTSPSRTFQVNGYISSFDGTTNTEIISSGGVGYFGTSTNHPLVLQTNNAERMRITAGGNVLIGTTTDIGQLLQVAGYLTSVAGGVRTFMGYDGTGSLVGTTTNHYFRFITNDTERMRITSGGDVGIGTTPSYKLDVNGSQRWIFRNSSSEITDLLVSTESANSKSKLSFLWYGSETAALKFKRGGDSTGGEIELWTQQEGSSIAQRLTINTSGNVGIGTTSPTSGYKMEIVGDLLLSTASGNRSLVLTTNNANAALNTIAGTGLELATDGSNKNLAFRTGTTTAMYINSSANVGIGTTGPDAIFHVARASSGGVGGQVVIDNPASSALGNTAEISFLTDAGASGAGTRNARILAVNENVGNGAANLQFHTWNGSASAERVRITAAGNVGIGTTSPSGIVGIKASGADGLVMEPDSSSANNSSRMFFSGSFQTFAVFNNSADLRFTYDAIPGNTSGTSLARFTNTGKYFRMEAGTGGIQFGGDTSADNALDDYEEGTWTPVVSRSSSAPSITYTYRTGTYTKIGNMVYIFFDISIASYSGGSGENLIYGLPFVVSNNMAGYSTIQWRDASAVTTSQAGGQLKGFAERTQSYIFMQIDNSGTVGFATSESGLTVSTGRLTGTLMYQV